jgi:hypothetical protein
MTGLSQICFRSEERLLAAQLDREAYYITKLLPAKLALDLEYVRHRSLLGDLWILARTVLAIWRPKAEGNGREVATGEAWRRVEGMRDNLIVGAGGYAEAPARTVDRNP